MFLNYFLMLQVTNHWVKSSCQGWSRRQRGKERGKRQRSSNWCRSWWCCYFWDYCHRVDHCILQEKKVTVSCIIKKWLTLTAAITEPNCPYCLREITWILFVLMLSGKQNQTQMITKWEPNLLLNIPVALSSC